MLQLIWMEKEKRHKSKATTYGIYLAIGSFIFAILAIIFDAGPVLPPFSPDFTTIDCESVEYLSKNVTNQTISFTIYAEDPVEYSFAYIPYFLSIEANSSRNYFHITQKQMKNLTKSGNNISFSVKIPIYGKYKFRFQCLDNYIGSETIEINNITDPEDNKTSSSFNPDKDIAVFNNVCYENGRIFFFTPISGNHRPIHFFDSYIPVEVVPWQLDQYLQYKNRTKMAKTSFLLSKIESGWWQSILFTLNPISESMRLFAETPKTDIYFIDNVPKGSTELLKRFNSKLGNKIGNESCFKRLVLPKTRSNINLSYEGEIRNALMRNFTQLRSTFVGNAKKSPKRIVLPSCISHLENETQSVCPDCEVYSLGPRVDVVTAADQVARSSILIGNHLNNLIHAVWLDTNNTAVIDVSPADDQVCINYAQKFVKNLNISYYNVLDDAHKNKKCKCKKFSCMKQMPPIEGHVNRTRFREVLSQALKDLEKPTI